jgi:hypothetical protein
MGTPANVLIGVGTFKVDGVDVGYTSGGVVLVKSDEKMDKEVDQEYAPVGIHKIRETMQLRTNLAEATLANLKIVWEQTSSVEDGGSTRTLSFGMNPDVVEHTLEFKGKSPEGYDRTYTVYKAVVWEAGEVPHQKDALSLIPVTFRLLPDTTLAAGKEYGNAVDTVTE